MSEFSRFFSRQQIFPLVGAIIEPNHNQWWNLNKFRGQMRYIIAMINDERDYSVCVENQLEYSTTSSANQCLRETIQSDRAHGPASQNPPPITIDSTNVFFAPSHPSAIVIVKTPPCRAALSVQSATIYVVIHCTRITGRRYSSSCRVHRAV